MRSLNTRLERLERQLPGPRRDSGERGWPRFWKCLATIYGRPGEAEGPVPPYPGEARFAEALARVYGHTTVAT